MLQKLLFFGCTRARYTQRVTGSRLRPNYYNSSF